MTIQSLAWAMEAPVPGTAKLVLLALANHANYVDGFVNFDAPTVAREASIQISGLWRYLGALERNGYLAKDERKTAEGERRDYWLLLDRETSAPWAWSAHDGVEHPDDADAAAPVSSRQTAPKSFMGQHQVEARKQAAAQDEAHRSQGVPIIEGSKAFHAWCGHLRARRQITPFIQTIIVNGKELRGFYRPTLFPPADEDRDEEAISA
jgi:hypothetical protein